MSASTVNIDEITSITERVPVGRYPAKLLSVEAKLSKNTKPMIVAVFEVTEGPLEGSEITIWYSLFVSVKNGKKYAGGILDLKRTFAAIGTPLPSGFNMPCSTEHTPEDEALQNADKVRKLFVKNFANKVVDVAVVVDKDRKDQASDQVYTRAFVAGLKTKTGAAKATTDILDDLDD